ncbi:MAG: hypothetical protein LBI58_06050 [Tannerellaceae bacterium]|jgi:hypothetical protein|nr:hypothetical protein [Tannerellaceae bacterium]
MKKTALILIWSGVMATACDSGDIYPFEARERDDNITLAAGFILEGDAGGADNYQLCLAAFEQDSPSPIVWTRVIKSQRTDSVRLTLSNIPPEADVVRLCLLTIGRRDIYDFFSFDISGAEGDVEIPLTTVQLELDYGKIQEIFERNTCTACHGDESGGGGLLLAAGRSYESLVNRKAYNSPKMRVEPFSVQKSFLIDVLTSDTLSLSHPHSSIIYDQDELNLLRAWIERGAKQ